MNHFWQGTTTDAAILLSAIAFVSSSMLTSGSISVLAAAPSSNISSINQTNTLDHAVPTNSSSNITNINQTKTLDHMLVQNRTKTNVPVTLPLTRGYVNGFEVFYISTEASERSLQ